LETVPARVVNAVTQRDEILAIQMIENLQREDLNPIDQTKGILAYIQAKYPDLSARAEGQAGNVYNPDGVINELMNYNLKPEKVSETMTETVSVITKIVGKSTRTLLNVISLLKLVSKIQEAISSGKFPVSQGYFFAANLGSPDFFTIFDKIMDMPVTNSKLEKMLSTCKAANCVVSQRQGLCIETCYPILAGTTLFNIYEAATAWFRRGKDYQLKCASLPLMG